LEDIISNFPMGYILLEKELLVKLYKIFLKGGGKGGFDITSNIINILYVLSVIVYTYV